MENWRGNKNPAQAKKLYRILNNLKAKPNRKSLPIIYHSHVFPITICICRGLPGRAPGCKLSGDTLCYPISSLDSLSLCFSGYNWIISKNKRIWVLDLIVNVVDIKGEWKVIRTFTKFLLVSQNEIPGYLLPAFVLHYITPQFQQIIVRISHGKWGKLGKWNSISHSHTHSTHDLRSFILMCIILLQPFLVSLRTQKVIHYHLLLVGRSKVSHKSLPYHQHTNQQPINYTSTAGWRLMLSYLVV